MHFEMRFCAFSIFCVLVIGVAAFDLESVLENVPIEDRADFLRYHLERGYSLKHSERELQVSKDIISAFSIDLYDYMLEHHQVTDEDILELLRDVICFDDGTCVDIGDVGVHPYTSI